MGSLFHPYQALKVFRVAAVYIVFLLPILFPNQVSGADADAPLYGMTVSGKRPGPPLWKVSNQDNVLWIFGTLRYLPKRLDWDPASVRFILSESEEFISPPRVNAYTMNPIKGYRLLRRLKRAQSIPDDDTLEELLPAELYARFLEARSIYAPGDDEILKLRPAAASSSLMDAARDSAGLVFDQKVGNKLRSIARGRRATVISHDENIDVDDFMVGYENIRLEDEVACLESTLETIATDLDATVVRANAWANGDAGLLLNLDYPDTEEFCGIALFKSDEVKAVVDQTRLQWVVSVEEALSNNKVTFADFPMREIAQPDGLLAQLRQQGYVVTGQ